jgi:hypothetical protein
MDIAVALRLHLSMNRTPMAFRISAACAAGTEDTFGPGWDNLSCQVSWTGGTGAVTVSFANGNDWTSVDSAPDEEGPNYATTSGICLSAHAAIINATLTDSTGATATRTLRFACH